ncbi:hypothetical protein JCM3770_001979 [Rhodotorula araucariae]
MTEPLPLPRSAAAPPTPQEIERKLGSPSLPPPLIGTAALSPSIDLPLQSISETEDGLGSDPDPDADADDSDASSLAANGPGRSPPQQYPPDLVSIRTSGESTTGRLSDNIALKSGYLMKKGERRKAWKKRWFVLRGGQLAMYKNDKEYRLLRLIPLTEIHAVAPIELKKHLHAFGIVTPRRTYYVKADSPDSVTSWCRLIERAKAEYAARATVASVDTPTAASPAQTPRQLSFSGGPRPEPLTSASASSAIAIPGSSPPSSVAYGAPASYASTSASSFGAGASGPGAGRGGGGFPAAPPNSLVTPAPAFGAPAGTTLLPERELNLGLDARLSQLDLAPPPLAPPASAPPPSQARPAPPRRPSARSETLAPVPELAPPHPAVGIGRGRSASSATGLSVSPGGAALSAMSSSEEDETFDPAAGAPLPSPGAPPLAPPAAAATGAGAGAVPQQVQAPDPNKVILAGYLMKQGKRKNWRKRWFVLQSGMLMYSRSHMDHKHTRQIPLSSILDAIEAPSASTLPSPASPSAPPVLSTLPPTPDNTFKIITPSRTFLVCAPSEEDEIKWLAALQCLVARRTHALTTTAASPLPSSPSPSASAAAPPPHPVRRPSQSVGAAHPPPIAARPPSGRQRSVTDAARQAVRDVERRFHPAAAAAAAPPAPAPTGTGTGTGTAMGTGAGAGVPT